MRLQSASCLSCPKMTGVVMCARKDKLTLSSVHNHFIGGENFGLEPVVLHKRKMGPNSNKAPKIQSWKKEDNYQKWKFLANDAIIH